MISGCRERHRQKRPPDAALAPTRSRVIQRDGGSVRHFQPVASTLSPRRGEKESEQEVRQDAPACDEASNFDVDAFSKSRMAPRLGAMRGFHERKNLLTGVNGMKLRMAILCAASSLAMAGCNTMEGMGTDIAKGGEKVQDASRKVRQDWREARDRHDREFESGRAGCASMGGAERDVCIERAHQRYSSQMSDARKTYPRQNRLAESDEDRAEDVYDAARERCEALRGDAEERCLAEARSRYRRR